MPQLFQVLKCFKCSVFQVHQVKKSNKWECNICGEKQSLKRHYGLGTGKECRLHVQKLNSIRGEQEMNEPTQLNDNSDEEEPIKKHSNGALKIEDHHSKWSDFLDEKHDVKVPEPNEAMYIGNAEVVLEIPSKRCKFNKPKSTSVSNISREYSKFSEVRRSPSPPPIMIYESKKPYAEESKIKNNKDFFIEVKDVEQKARVKQEIQTFVPPKVDKNSKWAHYADESAEDGCEDDPSVQFNDEGYVVTEVKLKNDEYPDRSENYNYLPNSLFSLCDENDLDDILNIM